jgi:hypothetical protein
MRGRDRRSGPADEGENGACRHGCDIRLEHIHLLVRFQAWKPPAGRVACENVQRSL